MKQAHIAVVGGGSAGIATAYYLAVKHAQQSILLIDKLQPMSLTTSISGELCADYMMDVELPAYARNFHPDRYNDPVVMAEIAAIESDGQL